MRTGQYTENSVAEMVRHGDHEIRETLRSAHIAVGRLTLREACEAASVEVDEFLAQADAAGRRHARRRSI
jgi:hypothetical protein